MDELPLLKNELNKASMAVLGQPNNKQFAYQHKILELLVREKTTEAKNTSLHSCIASLQQQLKNANQ